MGPDSEMAIQCCRTSCEGVPVSRRRLNTGKALAELICVIDIEWNRICNEKLVLGYNLYCLA